MDTIYLEEYPEGDSVEVVASKNHVDIQVVDTLASGEGLITLTRLEAIAAARAILAHFNEVE